jgi:hypothetical protein
MELRLDKKMAVKITLISINFRNSERYIYAILAAYTSRY